MRQTRRIATLAAALAATVLLTLTAQAARAQDVAESAPEVATSAWGPAAQKLDEFTRVGGCDHSARLDNLAIMLMEQPGKVGYVVAYGPEGEGSGTGRYRAEITKAYLVEARGIDESRVKTVYGGRYKDRYQTATELWLVSPGGSPPVPIKYDAPPPFTGMFAESEIWDSIEEGEGTGPSVGNITLAGFADALRTQPDTVAYVVAYQGEESTPGAWRRAVKDDAEALRKSYGVEAGRIKTVFGGYREESAKQLWILPEDAPPPVEAVERERRPEESVQLGTFQQYLLKYEDKERWVFERLADVLKEDEHLRGCLIVRPEIGGAKAREEALYPGEPPDVDLLKLAEDWKRRLAKDYGIGGERIAVIVAPAEDESSWAQLETWVIPPGAALPDPYPPAEEEPAEEEGEAVGGVAAGEPEPTPTEERIRPMEEMSATELKQRLDRGEDIQIIDVREQNEYDAARIPGSRLIPLGQVVGRADEIDSARETVVHCKGGVRSAKAIEALQRAGFKGRLVNLKGGITAWSDEVDPSVPKY